MNDSGEKVKNYSNKFSIRFRLIQAIVIMLLCVTTMILLVNTTEASSKYVIFPTNSTLNGVPYKELVAKWWTWFLGIPDTMHPINNPADVERCSTMQNGSVWFLPEPFAHGPGEPPAKYNYKCNIPYGKVIMLYISSTECDEASEGSDCDINNINKIRTLNITIDGEKVDTSNIGSSIFTDLFNVTYPDDPLGAFEAKNGTFPASAQGYFLFIHSLPVGEHNIDFRVVEELKDRTGVSQSDATYDLLIQ